MLSRKQLECHLFIFRFQGQYFQFSFSCLLYLVCNNHCILHSPLGWHFEINSMNNFFIIFIASTNLQLTKKLFTLRLYSNQEIHQHLYVQF